MSTFKYFMKTEHPWVVSCMLWMQPARAQRQREGSPRNKYNARMATADHDRQGQATHRQYKSRIVFK